MDPDRKQIVLGLAEKIRKVLEPDGWLDRVKTDDDLLVSVLEDALNLCHHLLAAERQHPNSDE